MTKEVMTTTTYSLTGTENSLVDPQEYIAPDQQDMMLTVIKQNFAFQQIHSSFNWTEQ